MKTAIETKVLLLFITFLLSACLQASRATPIDVLFVAYDQGESNAIKQLEPEMKNNGIKYRIYSIGRATEIFADNRLNISAPDADSYKKSREKKLPDTELDSLISTLSPGIVFTGMASVTQSQIINRFKKNGSYTIAFYDNFDPVESKDYVQPFLNSQPVVDEFHIPSAITMRSFLDVIAAKNSKLTVTGQPALELWDMVFDSVDTATIKRKLKLPDEKKVILFAGGYDSSFAEYFNIFIEATKGMPDIEFLVTYHPKTDGAFEREAIRKNSLGNVTLIENGTFSTAELSALADVIVVHKSSIATMARYKQKPTLFIAEAGYSNYLLLNNLSTLASTSDDVRRKLLKSLSSPPLPFNKGLHVESKASANIVNIFMEILGSDH